MPRLLRLRPLSEEEHQTLLRWSRSRSEPASRVQRAQILLLASQGQRVPAIAQALDLCQATVRLWLARFNEDGLAGLDDAPKSGRPPTYTSDQVGEVIAAVLTPPQELGLPFGSWTYERLAHYLHEVKGIGMQHSRIHEILQREGLRWRQQETWFGQRVDPDFAQKRGRLRRSI